MINDISSNVGKDRRSEILLYAMWNVNFYVTLNTFVEFNSNRKWPKRFSFNILIGWIRNLLIRETNRGFLEL